MSSAFSARRLGNIFPPLILMPTSGAYISATEADVVMKFVGPMVVWYVGRFSQTGQVWIILDIPHQYKGKLSYPCVYGLDGYCRM